MIERRTVSKLGIYTVGELLGSGGMASVYKGYDPENNRDVAIKVLNATEQSADFVKRFKREVKVLKSLRHPHIVQFYDFGEENEMIYMVQELLPGPTLADRIRRLGKRRIPDADIPVLITQLADALDFAHEKGIVHRDVKPSNIIYKAARQVVLTDFGIARSAADSSRTATGPGIVMGTPGYIAPEQAISSATITPACDIYALGVVLFEMVTGQLPFAADTPMGVVLKHLYDEPPPPRSLRPELPKALDDLLLRAMHKEPDKRFATAGELAQALQIALPSERMAGDSARAKNGAKRPAASPSPNPTPAEMKPDPKKDAIVDRVKPVDSKETASAKPRSATRAPVERKDRQNKATTGEKQVQTDTIVRWRVGLMTACIVGVLLLVGLTDLATITRGWNFLVQIAMEVVS